ncbi:hypothetical protein [Actinoplanes subtropicus]|uniref:hypothetical protein n=1 Tax=Actinoplanes subtropicus TaxID=543632 RepID=UPI00068A857E|nr:hypothetical protein [Actinoplanes subtropicus]
MKRSIRTWAASIGVVLMAAGGVALMAAAPAQAAVAPNQLTFNPATGTDQSAPTVLTAGPCPKAADGYRATVTGPGVFQPGLQITNPQSVNLSTTDPFPVQLENSMLDVAKDAGATQVDPGYYLVTVECRTLFPGDVVGTFTGWMHFTSSTAYVTGANVFPDSTGEPSAGASSSASASASATPSATATTEPTTEPPTTEPTTSSTTTAPTTPATTATTTAAATTGTLPKTGPPAAGLFALGVALLIAGGCIVLGTMRFDRPQPARW